MIDDALRFEINEEVTVTGVYHSIRFKATGFIKARLDEYHTSKLNEAEGNTEDYYIVELPAQLIGGDRRFILVNQSNIQKKDNIITFPTG